MNHGRAIWLGLAFLALQCTAADAVKTFEPHKCSYTLPGPSWVWQDTTDVPGALFVAGHPSGLVAMLMAQSAPIDSVSPEFISGIEKGALIPGEISKRSGQTLTFKGVQCYQLDLALTKVQRTVSSRFFIAHGYVYNMQVIGNTEPVEKSPEYDAIMNGFEFTVVPVPPSPQKRANSDAYNAGRRAGQIFVYVLVAAVLLALIRKLRS